jgi:hypothetical protein
MRWNAARSSLIVQLKFGSASGTYPGAFVKFIFVVKVIFPSYPRNSPSQKYFTTGLIIVSEDLTGVVDSTHRVALFTSTKPELIVRSIAVSIPHSFNTYMLSSMHNLML